MSETDLARYPNLWKRGNRYYVRIRVPADLSSVETCEHVDLMSRYGDPVINKGDFPLNILALAVWNDPKENNRIDRTRFAPPSCTLDYWPLVGANAAGL